MSWAQLSETDFLGTSPFQNLCCRQVRKFLPELEFTDLGVSEKVFVAHIPATNVALYLYSDSVTLNSATGALRLRSSDFQEPEHLVSKLIAELSNAI